MIPLLHTAYLSALRWWHTTLKALYKYQTLLYFTENAQVENAIRAKLQAWRMQIAGVENAGADRSAGRCRSKPCMDSQPDNKLR